MLFLGIDLGTSSVKASVVDGAGRKVLASASFPEKEAGVIVARQGWAEQSPDTWWEHIQKAILKCHQKGGYDPGDIGAIGVAYQMHGLVLLGKNKQVLRNAIIWSDGRSVEIGNKAFEELGKDFCLAHLLNSPGNFTASKLAWVRRNEPEIYDRIEKILLPGDFISFKFTGEITTTVSALSEGIFWDFKENRISGELLKYYGFDSSLFPGINPLFSFHGGLLKNIAEKLSLKAGIPVSYKAGDQPNNALSLNVLEPGEVAANGGTSGVIYGVNENLQYDKKSRINSFAHVNYQPGLRRIGVLLNINGTGIFNRWIRDLAGEDLAYPELNRRASEISTGSDGLQAIPFGNGVERMFENKLVGSHLLNLDFNRHTKNHIFRAVQEGIAFSFRYGLDIMRENGINPSVIRAGYTNLFLSPVFTQVFADVNRVRVEFFDGDGSFGAAIGAGIGAGFYKNASEALKDRKPVKEISPSSDTQYETLYQEWKDQLSKFL